MSFRRERMPCLLVWTMFAVLSTLTTETLALAVARREQGGSRRYFTEFGQLPALELAHDAPRQRVLQHTTTSSSSNQTDFTLPYGKSDCSKIPVTYTNDPKQVYAWFSDNLETSGCTIGFDVEFVPNLPWLKHRASFQGPATVQLATPDSCLVVHLVRTSGRRSQACSPILKAVLCDEMFVKAGCALDDDLLALSELWGGLEARSRLDLGGLGSSCDGERRRNNPRRGLKALSRVILGVDLPKPKNQILSDWSQVPLTEDQIMYSARDAWAAAAIVNRLAEHDPATFGNSNLIQWLESYEAPTSNLMERKKQGQHAKDELEKLLEPYRKVSRLSSSKARVHPARNLPELVVAKVRKLRDVIKTVRKDHPMPIEVDHLGFEFDDDAAK